MTSDVILFGRMTNLLMTPTFRCIYSRPLDTDWKPSVLTTTPCQIQNYSSNMSSTPTFAKLWFPIFNNSFCPFKTKWLSLKTAKVRTRDLPVKTSLLLMLDGDY